MRNPGDEDAAAAAAGEVAHPEPVVLELGRRNKIEVDLVCQRMKLDGLDVAWYFQSPLAARGIGSGFGGVVDAFVVVAPPDAEAVAAELVEAGLLYVEG